MMGNPLELWFTARTFILFAADTLRNNYRTAHPPHMPHDDVARDPDGHSLHVSQVATVAV